MEKPILFKPEMVRKILSGEKTQTRRIVNGPINEMHYGKLLGDWALSSVLGYNNGLLDCVIQTAVDDTENWSSPCPYGDVGNTLWVRETWRPTVGWEDCTPSKIPMGEDITYLEDCLSSPEEYPIHELPYDKKYDCKPWRPSIFMMRWMSRINLEITNIRVERLQDISEEDARCEGVEDLSFERFDEDRDFKVCPNCGGTRLYTAFGINYGALPDTDCGECDTYKKRFKHLWNSINGKRGFGWDVNPWLWVITFKIIK